MLGIQVLYICVSQNGRLQLKPEQHEDNPSLFKRDPEITLEIRT